VFQEKEIGDFKYYGTFVDPCNRKAMETFIRLTHDRYAQAVSEHFGKTIKGMFTDEIGLLGRIPWSPKLAEQFKRRNGYDLIERLPALLDGAAENAPKIRYDYYQTVHTLLREAYHEQVHDWCERHGLEYVAEVPSVRMTTQKYSHVPGGDSAHEKLGRSLEWILRNYFCNMRSNPKMVSSLSRQLGRTRNLIECFHSVGWSMTLQDARWMIDRMAAMGTNFYNFHAFYYTTDALAKHDAPPSQFLQNPYWRHFRQLGDYTGRISYIMSQGKADIRIALLDPVTSLWTHMGNPFHGFHFGGEKEDEKNRLERLRRDWQEVGVRLLRQRFDHLDPDLLAEVEVSGGTMMIGHAAYTVLIVPPVTNLEARAWAKIRQFLESGGTVIALGLLPHDVVEEGSPDESEAMNVFGIAHSPRETYWGAGESAEMEERPDRTQVMGPIGRAYFLPMTAASGVEGVWPELAALLEQAEPRAVRLLAKEEDPLCFLMQTRIISEGSAAVFVSNQEGGTHHMSLHVEPERLFRSAWNEKENGIRFLELDLESGESRHVRAERSGAGWNVPLELAPYQSRLMVMERAAEAAEVPASPRWRWEVDAAASWDLSPRNGNFVRLDDFRLRIEGDGREPSAQPWRVHAKTFIDQCSDLAEDLPFPVRFRQTFGTPMRMNLAYPIRCAYHTEFRVEAIPDRCELFMDRNAISGEWTLSVNGHPLSADRFVPSFVYDHRNVACSIRPYLREGINEIKVEMVIGEDWDGVTDPLYLKGTFGVSFDSGNRPVLIRAPQTAFGIKGGPIPGYPYFAGTMNYRRTVELAALPPTAEFELEFAGWDPHFHDCAEVVVNGQSLGVRPWTPYRWKGPAGLLRTGANDIEVRITNTLAGLLDGNAFDYVSHKPKPVKGWTDESEPERV
jgi:hypothetical protein